MIVFFNDDLGAFSNSSSPQALLPPHPLPHAVENRTGLLCVRAGIIHREPLLRGQVIPEALPLKSHIFVVVVVVIFNPPCMGFTGVFAYCLPNQSMLDVSRACLPRSAFSTVSHAVECLFL